jgi:hypothetical protein
VASSGYWRDSVMEITQKIIFIEPEAVLTLKKLENSHMLANLLMFMFKFMILKFLICG